MHPRIVVFLVVHLHTMPVTEVPSAAILRNKGCPIDFLVLDEAGEPVQEKGKDKTDKIWLKFTARSCAAIEEAYERRVFVVDVSIPDEFGNYSGRNEQKERIFEGLNAWEQSLDRMPYRTIIETLAIVLNMEKDEVEMRMVPGETEKYSAAIGASWAMANGLDPSDAGKLLAASLKAAQDKKTEMSKAMAELDSPEVEPPGETGSESGSAPTKRAASVAQ